jgi:nucleotide-binding universal stress UspA family protein
MRILLAVDGSQCSQHATRALANQFRSGDTQIHVLHAIDWPRVFPESLGFGEDAEFANDFKPFLEVERQRGRELTEQAAALLREGGFTTSCSVVEGDAKRAILDFAARWNPELIVLGSHGRRGIDRIILGSVSEAVARHAHCSVQIMRAA